MSEPAHKMKKRRADSAFGMHFDFHAHRDQENIGATADPEQLDRLLKRVKPDFVQCDTKGHFGYSSYPTEIGVRSPNQAGDILRMWRDVTTKNNVALYAHHSTLWEEAAVSEHPEWAIVDENGIVSDKYVSMFSPFLQERFIPQMIEIATQYGVDGTWIDGDIWCVRLDYSQGARDAYFARYGRELPKKGDAEFPQYLAFLRRHFYQFVNTYCDAIHEAAPAFQICSNGLMGGYMPESEASPVDFISGDIPDLKSLRLHARSYAQRNITWDTMSWAFAYSTFDITADAGFYYTTKELPQLCQEASLTMSLGGGYQFVNFPTIDHTYEWAIPRWEQLAEFCRAREPFCFKAKPVPQAAVFYSAEAGYHSEAVTAEQASRVYPETKSALETAALLDALLDNQYSTEVLLADRVISDERLCAFGLIAVPDMAAIEADAKERLLAYAREGGALLLTGPQTLALFADDFGITAGPLSRLRILYVACEGSAVAITSRFCEPSGDFTVTGQFYESNFLDGEAHTASLELPFGKGKIVALPFALADYANRPTALMRRFVDAAVKSAWQAPSVKVTGSQYIEVALMEKDGKRCVNLTNVLSGTRFTSEGIKVMTFDEIPSLHHIEVEIAWPSQPSAVMIEPEHKLTAYTYENGIIRLTLDKLEIHTVITVE